MKTLVTIAVLGVLAVLPACTSTCTATDQKLAMLRRGMTQSEAANVMGCAGSPVAPAGPNDDVSSLEWQGPGTVVVATRLDFQNDRLLYYVTRTRGGL